MNNGNIVLFFEFSSSPLKYNVLTVDIFLFSIPYFAFFSEYGLNLDKSKNVGSIKLVILLLVKNYQERFFL
ncbi:MAG: hypothetical protein ACI8UG_001394 [Gammaproteobacteria bacterium]|jgi:hypothetical protein